jgi:hypothetical protein
LLLQKLAQTRQPMGLLDVADTGIVHHQPRHEAHSSDARLRLGRAWLTQPTQESSARAAPKRIGSPHGGAQP